MKNNKFTWILLPVTAIVAVYFLFNFLSPTSQSETLTITNPYNQTVFPHDIASPTFSWTDTNNKVKKWSIEVKSNENVILPAFEVSEQFWQPDKNEWEKIISAGTDENIIVEINGLDKKIISKSSVNFTISDDGVEAPIFFRSVPLPFKFARENMKNIKWYFGSVSSNEKPTAVLENLPACGNCHSFTPNGKNIAMDVDANNDKGAYVITSFEENTEISSDSIISWSKFQNDKFTYGLLSQISPNGRYVISTLHDCEIFVDQPNMEYSQLFFPFKGILGVYDRQENRYFELEGANDTTFVQSNPVWTPDGKNIIFCKTRARHYEESGIQNGSVAKYADQATYQKFEKSFTSRDSLFQFDIYTIPFNDGKGGKAVPIDGASNNGRSNYFPRVSPDGKWLVFCQAESFMLLQKDSKLMIKPMEDGSAKPMEYNSTNMNSWHSWSPNSKWLVYASKAMGPYTQLYLTHINDDGSNTPPIYLERFSFQNFANNIPEFVNTTFSKDFKITPAFLSEDDFLIRNGEISQKSGDDQAAFLAYNRAVKKFPNKAEGYYKRGRILFTQKKIQEALNDLNKAVEFEKNIDYYVTRGVIQMETGEKEKAVKDFMQAIELDSTDYRPYSYLGVYFVQEENPQMAINYLQKAVKLYSVDSYSHYYLGLSQYYLNQFENAENSFSQGIKYANNSSTTPLLFEMRGNCRKKLNNFYGAVEDYNVAIKMHPNDPSLFCSKGESELKLGLKNDAIRSLTQAKQLGSARASNLLKQQMNM